MIYFDNSATTKPYKDALESYVKVSTDYFGNPSSLHGLGGQAEKLLSQARAQIAALMNIKPAELFFTSGGTESNNLAIKGAALMNKGRGRHLITTKTEHPSVRGAMEQLEEFGFGVTYLSVDNMGRVSVEELRNAIKEDTILVSVMHVNNEVGTIQPIKEIGQMLEEFPKILFHVDHVQGIGKVPLDINKSRIDFCSISGHKFHGLKGTGAIYIREGLRLSPLFSGGNQEWRQRSGTENVAGIVAMAKALRLEMLNRDLGLEKMISIQDTLRMGLKEIEGIKIHTPTIHSAPHILNFSLEGIKSEIFVHALEEKEIYVSTTSACSSKKKAPSRTLLAMGVPQELAESSIRLSLSFDNREEEALIVLAAIKETTGNLGRIMTK
ncbi:cysteine desulfurase family protein [Neobacillus sp. PS3-34]|uniref:cysteine desulfurase family protein n=1 Tax=Neobacillus sp. PS3-34 TaxID=3070678 RepID=UPI0027E029DA|nr:cysteine desulfurase family protein [Neobacillus sp. PS3-34]WML47286.1 cysteine desulfurase family protein [Neobacillus sp. PS3-34]